MGLAQQLHEAIFTEKKAIPPALKFWAEIDHAPANKYITTTQVDWGRGKARGQGKRSGRMVMGAMSDAPQGVKTYTHILGGVKWRNKDDEHEGQNLERHQQMLFAKAHAAGYSTEVAFVVAYTVGRDAMDRDEAYDVIKGLKEGATWKRNSDGSFTGVGFRQKQVELKKGPKAKQWLLVVDGKEYDLGKKASFTTAERKLATMR